MTFRESEVDHLWDAVQVLAKGPTNKETVVLLMACCLVYMMNDGFIAENFFSYLLEPCVLRHAFYAKLHMEGNNHSVTEMVHIPGMKVELYWTIQDPPSNKDYITRSPVGEKNNEWLWSTSKDMELIP
jgi:hypothetical protein